jgi:hypothetical protein
MNSQKGMLQPQISPDQIIRQIKASQAGIPSELLIPIPLSATYENVVLNSANPVSMLYFILFCIWLINLYLGLIFRCVAARLYSGPWLLKVVERVVERWGELMVRVNWMSSQQSQGRWSVGRPEMVQEPHRRWRQRLEVNASFLLLRTNSDARSLAARQCRTKSDYLAQFGEWRLNYFVFFYLNRTRKFTCGICYCRPFSQ